ncbi:MAG: hypothetical protein NVSMB65_11930 [Chloroflexota bacterium]
MAAVVVLPLIFSPNLTMIFSVPKASFLWCLATVLALVFLIKVAVVGVDQRLNGAASQGPAGTDTGQPGRWRLPWSDTPAPGGAALIAAALVLGVVAALATLGSVAPAVSWWGHYGSFTGLFTVLSLITIFVIVATHLRTRRQLEWLLVAAVWASVPFLRFGAAQKWNFSPLPWAPDVTPAVIFSPAGDTLATGAYLALIIPLTISLAVASRAVEFRLIYALLAVAQVAVMAVSGFVGAWIGIACGAFALALLLGGAAATVRARRLGILAGVVVAIVTLAGLLFYARAQDTSWRPPSMLQSAVDGARGRSGALDYRRQVWQGTWDLSLQRPLLGWGPDTFVSTFGRTAPFSLQAATDRGGQRPAQSFNLPLEMLQGSGVLGLLAWLGTLVAFFGTAIALLRRRATSRQGHLMVAALLASMIAYLVTTLLTLPGLPALVLSWVILAVVAALAGPLWEHVANPAAPDSIAEAEGSGSAAPAQVAPLAGETDHPAPPGEGRPAETPAAPLTADPWRGIGALLAVGALALFFVPAPPLGLFWQSVQQVRADAWNHEGQAAETASDPARAARTYRLAFASAPFQPQYGLNAGRGVLQNLATGSAASTKARQLALLGTAEADLKMAHALDPWDVGVATQLARLWGVWGSLAAPNRFAEAQRLIDVTEQQHLNDVSIITDWAQTAQQLGRPDVTVQQYAHLATIAPGQPGLELQAAAALSALVDTAMQAQPRQVAVAEDAVAKGLDAAHKAADATPRDPGAAWLQIAALSFKNAQVVVTVRGTQDRRSQDAVRQMLDDHMKALTYRPADATTVTNGIKAALFLRDAHAAYRLATLGLRYHPGDATFTQVINSLPKSARH